MTTTVPRILIVGGGYAGFYTAWKLEKLLGRGEAEVTLVDPLPYMTYQPFLPEVAAGEIEPRHVVVGLRRHLKRTTVIAGKVTGIEHASKTATITPIEGDETFTQSYDQIVVTAGAVSRTFPIPGIADNAIGLKTIEEAVAIRDRLTSNFDKASVLPAGPERDRLLTVVVVGGGFAGIEVFAELRAYASSLLKFYPTLAFEDTHFHLIEAMGRIMPEVSQKTSEWVLADLAKKGAFVHLDTQVKGAVDGVIELSTGEQLPTDLIIWTRASWPTRPSCAAATCPSRSAVASAPPRPARRHRRRDRRGCLGRRDVSAVPDLSVVALGGFCVPNASTLCGQGKLMAKNIVAVLRGEQPKEYNHRTSAPSRGLGLYNGAFQSGNIALTGLIAWFAHRGYHGWPCPRGSASSA